MSKRTAVILAGTLSIASIVPVLATAADAQNANTDSSLLNGSVAADYRSGKYGALQATRLESLTRGLDGSVKESTTLSLSLTFPIHQAP